MCQVHLIISGLGTSIAKACKAHWEQGARKILIREDIARNGQNA